MGNNRSLGSGYIFCFYLLIWLVLNHYVFPFFPRELEQVTWRRNPPTPYPEILQ